MSYASVGAFGNGVETSCARLQTEMPGTATFMPGKICPETSSKTGHQPPRPRICGGSGVLDVQQGLKYAGIYKGAVDGIMNASFTNTLSAIAQAYNVPWNGDGFAVGPNLCGAIIAEIAKSAPPCSANYDKKYEIGCVVKPTGPLMQPLATQPTQPTTGQPKIVGAKITIGKPPKKKLSYTPKSVAVPGPGGAGPVYLEEPSATVGGVPTWALVAAGVAVVGGAAYFLLKKKS